jgi:uncharacterized protein (TIGR02246 family)
MIFKNKPRLLILLAVSAGIAFSNYASPANCAFASSKVASKTLKLVTLSQTDKDGIRSQIASLSSYIAAGDAKSLSTLWTEDASYIDSDGNVVAGRDNLEKRFATQFKDDGKQSYVLSADAIRALSTTVAQSEGTVHRKEGTTVQPETRYSMVFVKEHGSWKIASAVETPIAASEATGHESLADLSWLVGDWKAERNGGAVRMKAEWASDKNFIRCTYEIKKPNQPVMTDFQVIGWDPIKNQIVSWLFNASGGVGHGFWYKKGAKWVVESSGLERDGSTCGAINIIEPTDPNTFVWESLNRSVDGIALGDTLPLKIERVVQ